MYSTLIAYTFSFAAASAQNPCFEAAQNPPVAVQSTSIASGDLDGDGDVDVALMTSAGIELLFNQGLGTFAPPVQLGAVAASLCIADLDDDGAQDLVYTDLAAIQVRFNQGGGSFAAPIALPTGIQGACLRTVDLDADGDLDLATTGQNSLNLAAVVANLGNRTFAPAVTLTTTATATALAAGDVDGDGDVDLVVSLGTGMADRFANQGNGTFVFAGSFVCGGGSDASGTSVELGDLDGDGDLDLAVPDLWNEWVAVARNLGGGVFAQPVLQFWGSMPTSVAFADVDGDGALDAVVGYANELAVSVARNLGNGTFAPHVLLPTGYMPMRVAIADLDADGDLDLAAAIYGGAILSVLRCCRISGTSTCAGDGSGTPCPCANDEPPGARAGCRNSLGVGARLAGSGSARVALDGLVLSADQMPTNASAVFFQGTLLENGGAGLVFDDGLACAGGALVRIGTKTNAGGSSSYPGPGDPSVHVRGAVTVAGERVYQVRYRNPAAFCTPATSNASNALRVLWAP